MERTGYIKLYRSLLDNPISEKPHYVWLWITLLLKANHKTTKMIWNNEIIFIYEGQFITGRKELSKQSGIPQTTIEDILTYLEKQQQIRQQKTNKYRLITILNWKRYQQSDNKATTKRQQSDTNKNDKNDKNGKKDTTEQSSDGISSKTGSVSEKEPNEVFALMLWAEERRAAPFLNRGKQLKAIGLLKKGDIPPSKIKERWKELEDDKFWKTKGFDFMDIFNSINRKP